MRKPETWYVLEDGSCGDPRDVAPGAEGRLVHKDGRAVAYRPDGETPLSRSVTAADMAFGGKGDHDGDGKPGGSVPSASTDMRPEDPPPGKPRRGYKTRETKAG